MLALMAAKKRAPGVPPSDSETRTISSSGFAFTPERLLLLCLAGYLFTLTYVEIYPGAGWRAPGHPVLDFLRRSAPKPTPLDVASNGVLYLPWGFLLSAWWSAVPRWKRLLAISGSAAVFSFSAECAQVFLPYRYASWLDIVSNTGGALLGAVVHVAFTTPVCMATLAGLLRATGVKRHRTFGLVPFLLWALALCVPPSASVLLYNLRHLSPPHLIPADIFALLATTTNSFAAIQLALHVKNTPAWRWTLGGLTVVAVAVRFACSGADSMPQPAAAIITGALTACLWPRLGPRALTLIVLAGFGLTELRPGEGSLTQFNWVPLESEIQLRLNGIRVLLEQAWPFVALGFLHATAGQAPSLARNVFAVGIYVFLLEYAQSYLPGRNGDVTTVLIACLTFYLSTAISLMLGRESIDFSPQASA